MIERIEFQGEGSEPFCVQVIHGQLGDIERSTRTTSTTRYIDGREAGYSEETNTYEKPEFIFKDNEGKITRMRLEGLTNTSAGSPGDRVKIAFIGQRVGDESDVRELGLRNMETGRGIVRYKSLTNQWLGHGVLVYYSLGKRRGLFIKRTWWLAALCMTPILLWGPEAEEIIRDKTYNFWAWVALCAAIWQFGVGGVFRAMRVIRLRRTFRKELDLLNKLMA